MLTIENVTKRFGEIVALDRVSLSLARGEFFGLLGPNGAFLTSPRDQIIEPASLDVFFELFVPKAIQIFPEICR